MIPGTRLAVTSAYDSAVGIFDLESGEVELLGYHDHLVNRIVVSPDGALAASCSSDYSICLWDLRTRRKVMTLLGHSDDVEDFVFADAETGVSASRDWRLLVWDLRTGAVRRVLEGHQKDVLVLAVAEGRVYSSGDDMTLRVWDLATGEQLSLIGPFEDETDTCAIDPGRKRAILGCDDGCIRVFDTASGQATHVIEAHASGIKKVAVSAATGDILSAAYDQKIVIWDAATLEARLELDSTSATWERSLTWSPDGAKIVGGTFDGTVLVWDSATGRLESEIGEPGEVPGNPCFNEVAAGPSGTFVVVSDDGFVRRGRLTPEEGRWECRCEPLSGRILANAVTYDEEYRMVVTGAHDHTVHIFDSTPAGLEREREVALGEGPINSVRIARHRGYERDVFVACYSSAIVRLSPEGEIEGKVSVHEGAVKSLRLHPAKRVGVSCGADGLLLGWSFEGELLHRYLGHTAIINDVDLEPGGERLASVSRDFSLKIFELETGRMQQTIPIGRKSLKSVCFWSDEVVLVGDYWGGLIRVDLKSESYERAVVAGNGISSVARCGGHAVLTSYDGAIYLVRPDLAVVRSLRAMHQRLARAA
ncbi:MAG: WD40 repeat domain-containing protein [Thermoanaerobaculia bacterium]|nr:WD40 repeat domain-containing protein [Thermoanaerobaculia bacterium]